VPASPPLVRALHDLSFAAAARLGGPVRAADRRPGRAPRRRRPAAPLAGTGLVIALAAEFPAPSLLTDGAAYLLPVARFAGFAWLITAGALLPQDPLSSHQTQPGIRKYSDGNGTHVRQPSARAKVAWTAG
jgi:hypothetical protein